MFSLPQIIEEDIQELDAALCELLARSEASLCLLIDIGGFLITQKGALQKFDTVTIGALASASYAATQAIAGMVNGSNFDSIYQRGATYSLLLESVNSQCLLVVLFDANINVGVVKYYSASTLARAAEQLRKAQQRDPDKGLDLSTLNLADPSPLFRRKSEA
jgi:predicted regulator of Ras-like GTPase activity (Roadblock/LC7/MglB family)